MKNPFVLLVIMMTLLMGCNAKETTTVPSNSSETPTQPAMPTPATGGPAQAPNEQKLFTFAIAAQFKPFNFEQDGKPTGFDVEVGEEIARRLGMEPQAIREPYETLLEGVKGQKYNAVISSLSATPQRAEEVAFTVPYYRTGAQLFVKADNENINPTELKEKSIGAVDGSVYHWLAKQHSKKVKGYPNYNELFQALSEGKVEGIVMDRMMGLIAIKDQNQPIKPAGDLLHEDQVAIAVHKDHTELVNQINQAITEMMADGTYEKISVKWLGVDISK
ncbi:transporter substrate-binding domain-containing protein [Ammoniphilus sp. YIM 78166]|uniref:transporter substrate-binding domain-containing protein n=1 Tax=Ammoniphilus sp. YIM 78166 TaxID=1644106 RepID=UPI00106F75EC|nr:transporter substrate-binding domain-containing protein [Ammoniphilus sp. YIM 78166]